MRGPRPPQVGQMQRSSHFQSTRGNLQQRLIHCFICSNLVSRSPCAFFTAFIPVPIVTCLHGNSCVILAEAMIWSSRRSSWTLPRGPDLRGSSANPHQGAEALQIICVNFYGKCLCKVMHIDLHLCFMQGWRYTCARWSPAVGALAPDTVERFFECSGSVFDPEFEHLHGVQSRTAPSLCLCTLLFGLSSVSLSHVSFVNFLWWSCWAGSVVGFHPGWRLSEEAVLPAPKQWSNQPVVKSRSCGAAVLWLSRSIWWHSGFLC